MRKLGTAPNLQWFRAWLMDQGEKEDEWRYIASLRNLYQYRDVELHVVVGYPSGFAPRPGGWEEAIAFMATKNIREVREL